MSAAKEAVLKGADMFLILQKKEKTRAVSEPSIQKNTCHNNSADSNNGPKGLDGHAAVTCGSR